MAVYDNTQLSAKMDAVELWISQVQSNTVAMPMGSIDVNDTTITDKTGWCVYGKAPGINTGLLFVGVSLVATPTTNAHIEQPFIFKAF